MGDIGETLVAFGGELKALGDGRVGGYLVVFSGPNDPDLTGDFFTKDTDFGDAADTDVYYHHGLDQRLGRRKLTVGKATLKKDDIGVWMEGQLALRDDYEKFIHDQAAQGREGLSSGTAAHLVEREQIGKAYWIKSWPLGLDGSITPTPAEPRTSIVPLKSLQLDAPAENGSTVSPGESEHDEQPAISDAKGLTAMEVADVQKVVADALKAQADVKAAEEKATADRAKAIKDAVDEERKKWEAEAKTMRRGSYAYGGGRTSPEDRRDDFAGALKAWVLDGDKGGFGKDAFGEEKAGNGRGLESLTIFPTDAEQKAIAARQLGVKASNATDMNIGTAADGGDFVPTGFYPQVILRRDESMLRDRLGVRMIPGQGTTVDVPVDNEADGEFVVKAEANDFDLDAPAVAKKSMTLVKYTKYTDVSYELLDDTPVALEAFLADFVGRGMAKTHNSLLLTEVASGGTAFVSDWAAAAIAAGDVEELVSNDDLSNYLDEDNAVAFVMRASTHWAIKSILGNPRVYGSDQGPDGRMLLGYPVYYSQKAAAVAASAKSAYFGNWRYVGNREAPGLTFIRDPFTVAIKGQVRLLWHFRTVYKTLQAEAIGYAAHASA